MEQLLGHFLYIGKGVLFTFELLLGGLIIGITLAIITSILRYNKVGVKTIGCVISVLRGTPLILQLAFVYFCLPPLLGFSISILSAGILTFGLNSFAYLAEIFRAGVASIPKGQFEAARCLHISSFHMWKDIIFPQVLRNVLPAMTGEVIALLKETALIATIGGMDIMRLSQTLAAEQFTYFMPLCIAGAYYYCFVLLIGFVGKKLEQRGQYAVA